MAGRNAEQQRKASYEKLSSLAEKLEEHERLELDIWDKFTKHQEKVDQSILVLNHEMGEVIGELRAIKWMVGGGLGMAIILQILLRIFM